jgi:hypothetical protein
MLAEGQPGNFGGEPDNCHLQHVVEIGRDGLLDALFALATYSRKKMPKQESSIHDHHNRL